MRAAGRHIQADLNVPVLAKLADAAKEFRFGEDWRVARKDPGDVGERPSLDSLGPFRWHPSPAPHWQLAGADGKSIALADYRGKPLVLLFYLGHGCVHCTEQLKDFSAAAKDFDAAGISLLAVSTDRLDDLSKSLNELKADASGAAAFPSRSSPTVIRPSAVTAQSATAVKASRNCVAIRKRRRSRMSARAPLGSPSTKTGKVAAVCTSATQIGVVVRLVIVHAAATSFIHMQVLATSQVVSNSLNTGKRNGSSAAGDRRRDSGAARDGGSSGAIGIGLVTTEPATSNPSLGR